MSGFLALGAATTAFCQAVPPADPVGPGQHDHMNMGAHHMNLPMGEESCAPTYTYADGLLGPSHWAGMCQSGRMQSPVDIRNAQTLPIKSVLSFRYRPVNLDVINDCNGYRVLVRFPDNDWLRVGRKPYFLSELHFRLPGENAVDGKRPRMSVELVHLDSEATIAIVEVPVVVGKEHHGMSLVLSHIPLPGKEGKFSAVSLDATDFLPVDRSFYRAPGSLTTPICNEGVTWFVMKHPIEFSEAQIIEYMKHYRDSARPLQPLNGRPVAASE